MLILLVCAFGSAAAAEAQNPPVQSIVYDSDLTGRFEIYLKNLDVNNLAVGSPVQLTNAGAVQQQAQEPQFSLAASANATTNPDYLGRIVYQFGASGVRGLHLIKPLPFGSNIDVQLTPQPVNGAITGGPLKGKPYPCKDARDPAWSPDGLHIVYACLEPLLTGIGSSYDLWVHDTNGTPDDPTDDADYPLLILNGPLALQPTWSPDGTQIAYMTNMASAHGPGPTPKIGLIPANLGSVFYGGAILTDDAFSDIEPAWDPSGSFIAFSTTRKFTAGGASYTNGSNRTIWTMTTAGQIVSQLTGTSTVTANDTHPAWPSSKVFFFQSDRSNGNNSWWINPTTPESFGGSVLQVTGAPGDPSIDGEGAIRLDGIDISSSANLIDISKLQPPYFVVVDLYGGVDYGSTPPHALNPGCKPTLNVIPTPTSPDPNCSASVDVQNLIAVQNGIFLTGAFIELSFVPNSCSLGMTPVSNSCNPIQDNTSYSGVSYGAHAVDYAYSAIGSAAWNSLDFVAIAVERSDAAAPYVPWGMPCDRVREVVNAINEVEARSIVPVNTVIYTNKVQWNDADHLSLGGCADPVLLAQLRPHLIWEPVPKLGTTSLGFGAWDKTQRIGIQYSLDNTTTSYGPDVDLDVFDPSILQPSTGSTGVGANVAASVVNTTTGIASFQVTFSNATAAGVTTASSSTTGPAPPPAGYKPVSPQNYYDITTSALYTGPVQVCLNYTGISYGIQAALALFHYVNNAWTNVTSSSNPATNTICGSATSLSPFAIFEQGTLATPVLTISGGTFAYDGAAHGATASATGVSGGPVSGSFTITYTPGGSSPPVNPGTYSVTAQFTSADPSYTNANSTGAVTITPAPVQTPTTTPTGSMQFARVSHQATLLSSGLVLVSGGQNGGAAIAQSELYNPATGTWSLTGSNVIPRFDHTATVLTDGRVLATGGASSTGDCTSNVTAETYDPAKGTWSLTGRLPSPVGTGHIAVLLLDGRVLVSGGGDRCGNVFNTAAIFDPSTSKWSATGNMTAPREFHSAALLSDGRVLVAGGATSSPFPVVASAEIYDPKTGVWTTVSSMGTARQTSCNGYTQPYLASLPGGTVLAAGGFSGPNCSSITPKRTVSSLTVSPSPALLSNIGQTQALTVNAQMSDASTQLFTGPLQFSSADTTVATVDSNGLATSVGAGSTTITVTASGIAPVTVTTTVATRNLTSINASPSSITFIGAGQTQPLAINGQYSDGSQQALTSGVTFASSNTAVASVDATGLITSAANGTATITVSASGAPAVQVAVTVKSLASITVSPTSITLTALGQVQPLTVTGLFSDGSMQVLTNALSFISSTPAVARVDLSGNVTALSNGTTTITVSIGSVPAVQVPVTVAVAPPALLSITKSHTGSFAQGQQSATYTVTVSNAASAGPTTGIVTVTDTLPTGLTLVSMSGTGWLCGTSSSCTRSDALVGGASYPPITVTVNVAAAATSPLVNAAAVSGGGSASANATDSTTITAPTSALSITKSHAGVFLQGQQGATYTVLVSNVANTVATSGTVTVTDTLPTGLTLVSMTGTGWQCAGSTCTRSDVLAPGASYPPITVTVNVVASATSPQLNVASVSGGGSASVNTSDLTTIALAPSSGEADAMPFSALNLAGVTGGIPLQLESDALPVSVLNIGGAAPGQPAFKEADGVPFSVLNIAGSTSGGNQAAPKEVDAWLFSVLNLGGVSGNQPVHLEADGVPFSVLNTGGSTGGGTQPTPFEVDGWPFSILNLAGVSGNQPIPMEADGIPFSVNETNPGAPPSAH